jgi:hypothetical protein
MPELKNLFVQGKMNKDLEERLIPQGEYIDAVNIDVAEGGEIGILKKVAGVNQLDTISLTDAKCIGSVRDTKNDKIYWFITSDTKDIIAEFNGSDASPVIVDTGSVLNFSTSADNYITGVNVLDGVLYFTDNLNEPKQIDIAYWKTQTSDFNTVTTGLSEDRITVIKKGPIAGPRFQELEPSLRGGNGTIGGNVVKVNYNLYTPDINGTVNIYDSQYKAADETTTIVPNWQVNDIVEFKNRFTDDFGIEREAVIRMQLASNGTGGTADAWTVLTKTSEIKEGSVFYTAVLEEDEPLFELKFPKFAYRYKYRNGQYSKMSPFGEVAFIPGNYDYSVKEGFNTGMVNTVRKLVLRWFTDATFGTVSNNLVTPAAADVEEIEILYKDSVGTNVYIVDTIKKDSNGQFAELFEVKDEQIFKAAASNQLLRSFDSVPRKAKSQEIVANRLIYGNYLHNFNFTSSPTFNVSTINYLDYWGQNKSIKSGRTYQVGITFQDEYGRETPVFTDKSGIIKIPYKNAELKQIFRVSTTVTAPTEATHFKYYIKEVSNPYYNIGASNVYEETETGHLYLSFPSSEVNKVSENDIIIFKKGSGNSPYKLDNNKFKVLSKLSEPPNFLANKEEVTYVTDYLDFNSAFGTGTKLFTKAAGLTPVPGHNTIQIADAGRLQDDSSPNEVDSGFIANITVGSEIRFRRAGTTLTSKKYKVKAIYSDPDGDREIQMEFETPFGDDVNIIYDSPASNSTYQAAIEKVETKSDLGNPEYEGKFFIKLNADPQLKQGLFESIDESTIGTIATHAEVNMTERLIGDGDIREYFVSHAATINQALGQITTISGETLTNSIPSGFHIVLVTENPYGDSRDQYGSDPFGQGIVKGNFLRFSAWSGASDDDFEIDEVQTGFLPSSNQKFFAVKFTSVMNHSLPSPFGTDTTTPITIDVRAYIIDKSATFSQPPVFEVEPEDGVLDIYYEDFQAFPVAQLGNNQDLEFSNCFSFGNGVESDRIRDDYNAPILGKGVRVSTVFEDNYQEERLETGLIFSGIYNSKNGVNRLNQFIIAEPITKELNPEYGSIQKLHTRDTDLIAFCEDKVLKVLANKDALFNADGNVNITSNTAVLGQAIPFAGEYGISKNPESFASHAYRTYFTDRARGKVLRLSLDGITEISDYGMKSYFKDQFKGVGNESNTPLLKGSYNVDKNQYNITFGEFTIDGEGSDFFTIETVTFSESVKGWPSRKTFIPESGLSLNGMYYTFKNGHIYSHNSPYKNRFYGNTFFDSSVELVLNQNPSTVKDFKTLNYHGTSDWVASITSPLTGTDVNSNEESQQVEVNSWVKKEGRYYNYIKGKTISSVTGLDLEALNVQGLGVPTTTSGSTGTFAFLNSALGVGDKVYNTGTSPYPEYEVTAINDNVVTINAPTFQPNVFWFFAKNNKFEKAGVLGEYIKITMTHDASAENSQGGQLFSVGSEVSLSSL